MNTSIRVGTRWRFGRRLPGQVTAIGAMVMGLTLAGCAVGPDYARPSLPRSQGYASTRLPERSASAATPGGESQRIGVTGDVQADWWKSFGSRELDTLIAKAFAASPTLEAAQAALRVAQQNVAAQQGLYFPTVQAGYSPSRTKIAANQGGNSPGVQGNGSVISTTANTPADQGGKAPFNAPVIYNFHTAQVTVGFVPDVFGGNRRQVESLSAQARYQQLELEASYVTLASNVAAAAIQEAALRRQITVTEEIVAAGTQSLALVQRQVRAGYASRLDLALQEAALAQARQQLPPLRKQFEQTRDLLRSLAGGTQDVELPEIFELDALHLPTELPLSLPSQLVEQRPDVLAAEAQLRAASAQVGVAMANRLPQFSIDGSWGGAASQFSQMFWDSGRFFSLAGNVTQSIFDGGTLLHRQRAAEENLRQSAALYRSTAITAFQNVADSLHALYADADALAAAVDSEQATQAALDLIRRQLAHGYADRLAMLSAEQAHNQAMLLQVQARAARLGDTVALFQSLGGGWWHREADPAASAGDRK